MRAIHSSLWLLVLPMLGACSGSNAAGPSPSAGNMGSGGANHGSSTPSGGNLSQGGLPSSGGVTHTVSTPSAGGNNATGGANAGGNSSPGGTKTTGGKPNSGGASVMGGANAAGGSQAAGGAATGGSANIGGTQAGGATAKAGTQAGGATVTGGTQAAGGAVTTGGIQGDGGATAAGGTKTIGSATTTGGAAGNCAAVNPNGFAIGVDLTGQETMSTASRAALLAFLKLHGINYVRLRTFVDPKAADGYDKANGYDDIDHTVAFGKQVKDACMGLLVDFHYSDNWADAGKQCVPAAWQSYTTITDLANALYTYTKESITKLVAGGARPDMVQIGNEETPGILIHVCDGGGLPLAGAAGYNKINGAIYLWSVTDNGAPPSGSVTAGGWTNLGQLLNAAAKGVKDADPGIKIALHLDRGNDLASSKSFIQNATSKGVPFDIFGESCYVNTQGQPSDWQSTFASLSSSFPNIKFMIAEYGGAQRAANDVIYNLPNNQGIGTFNWTPNTLWSGSGTSFSSGADTPIYDQMKTDYASRL